MSHKCDGCRYKSEHQEMGFAPMGVCTRTLNLVEAMNNYNAEKCPYKKTNYERIKAMSLKEMALAIDMLDDACEHCVHDGTTSCGSLRFKMDSCIDGIIKWLKKEVEE